MVRTGVRRAARWRRTGERIGVVALAVVGLSVFAIGPSGAAATRATTASVVGSAENAKLGTILVASNRAVYTLKPSKTGCTKKCLKAWLPVRLPHGVKTPTAGAGVDASKLGTVASAKGTLQITYAGQRLYWLVKDKAPGQAHGTVTTKWGRWSTVTSRSSDTTATTLAPTTVPSTPSPAQTSPPQTAAPDTSPPATEPTSPPRSEPTTSPGNGGIGF